jgi:hypothetical protein
MRRPSLRHPLRACDVGVDDDAVRIAAARGVRSAAAAGTANNRVLLHPTKAPAVVQSSNHVSTAVTQFHGRLGIHSDRQSANARRWADAAKDVRDKALQTGADRVAAARRIGAAGAADRVSWLSRS